AVVVVRVLRGLRLEERQRSELLGERVYGPRAREWQVGTALLEPIVLLAVVGHVLADALLTGALEAHDRRLAEEVRARLEREQIEAVPLDFQREIPHSVVQAHKAANATETSPASRALESASERLTSCVRPP